MIINSKSYNIMEFLLTFSKETKSKIGILLTERFSDLIFCIRNELSMTQEKLAEISEVEPRTIQRLERGDSVSKQTLLKIVIALSSYHNIKIKISYELHKTHQNPEILLKFSFISILDHILKSKYKKATK